MKRIALVAAMLAVTSCTKTDETPIDTGAAMAPVDTGAAMAPIDTGAAIPPDITAVAQGQTVELTRARSLGYVDYAFSGKGNAASMNLTIVSRSDREWTVSVEVGTKLEPSNGDVQAMVVTREVHVHMHPHESRQIEIQANCLDITKDPPSSSDVHWTVAVTPSLASFIVCINHGINKAKAEAASSDAAAVESIRSSVVQISLWKARGATTQQWVDFFVHYHRMTEEEAQQTIADIESDFGPLVEQCGSI